MRRKKYPFPLLLAEAVFLSLLLILAASPLISCGKSKGGSGVEREEAPLQGGQSQSPGTLVAGVYLSSDGRFTIHADSEHWEPDRENPEPGLRNTKENSISVTFSWVEGLNREAIAHFNDRFVESYLEEVRLLYPNAEKEESRVIDEYLAELDMSMTDETGRYPMLQMLWLATDGENGYIVTAALPGNAGDVDAGEQKDVWRQELREIVESMQFLTAG